MVSRRPASAHQPESPLPAVGALSPRAQTIRAAVSDGIAVVLFCVLAGLGLGTQASDIGQLLVAFLPALALAWVAARAWRKPSVLKPTGLGLWVATAMVGLAIVALINNARPSTTMVVVTVGLLGVLLLGWRGLVTLMNRSQN